VVANARLTMLHARWIAGVQPPISQGRGGGGVFLREVASVRSPYNGLPAEEMEIRHHHGLRDVDLDNKLKSIFQIRLTLDNQHHTRF
jgi:hypothetical protein